MQEHENLINIKKYNFFQKIDIVYNSNSQILHYIQSNKKEELRTSFINT